MRPDIERFDEQIRGVEYVLATSPEVGVHVRGKLYAIATESYGLGEFVIFYSFDDTHVYRHSIIPAHDFSSESDDT